MLRPRSLHPLRCRTRFRTCIGAIGLLLSSGTAAAQGPDIRPADVKPEPPGFLDDSSRTPGIDLPEVPDFAPPRSTPGTILPPPPGVPETAAQHPALSEVRVDGVTALRLEELDQIVRRHLGQPLDFARVQEIRDDLTQAYVSRGFVTSGVTIPNQIVADGVLTLHAVEGRVTQIDVETDGRLRVGYVEDRLALATGPPVRVDDLERALQRLQNDLRIRSVAAELVAGSVRGEATLRVRVREAAPFDVRIAANNHSSPALGGERGELRARWNNVTGFGDALSAEYRGAAGLQDVRGSWQWPVTRWDTRAGIHFRRTWSQVVEDPFDAFSIEIESRTETYGFELSQPLFRSSQAHVEAFVLGEWRRSRSSLFGRGYSFVPGPHNGVAKIAVLRAGAHAAWRSRNHAVAARTQFTRGFPWLGATRNSANGVPDAEFFSWLFQVQWASRFPDAFGLQVVARADVQVSDRPLFSLEQFAIGGHATVRGYRENRVVRDNGAIGSIELRAPLPLPSWGDWKPTFELAPFFDIGHSWNSERPEFGPQTLMSAGIGGRFGLLEGLDLNIYWARDLQSVPDVGNDDPQDDGVHVGAVWSWP
jgi:hemolysin activation/secretion protein